MLDQIVGSRPKNRSAAVVPSPFDGASGLVGYDGTSRTVHRLDLRARVAPDAGTLHVRVSAPDGVAAHDQLIPITATDTEGQRFDVRVDSGRVASRGTWIVERRALLACGVLAGLGAVCGCRCADASPPDHSLREPPPVLQEAIEAADLLFVVDDSASMATHQSALARGIDAVLRGLPVTPFDPSRPASVFPHVKSLHVAVVSSDLGTPGSVVPTCAASEVGDDGLLNPIRHGLALRAHPPWGSAPPGDRPARCTNDPAQYPSFLTFDTGAMAARPATNAAEFRDDFACNAYLSTRGCDLEQPLESAYRALVVRNAREQSGNGDPNAGFVRGNAALAVVVVTDEEDGSVRDCRFREEGQPCVDATSVFDARETRWSSSDLNLRFYMYAPGSAQDPTWPLDRYIDPARPNRGFTSLKPEHPERVIFAAIAGVPLRLPTRGAEVDYDALLGLNADGSDGYTAMDPDGPSRCVRPTSTRAARRAWCPRAARPAAPRHGATSTRRTRRRRHVASSRWCGASSSATTTESSRRCAPTTTRVPSRR